MNVLRLTGFIAIACFGASAIAQEPTYDFEYMDIQGDLDFDFETGRPDKISNGAEIVLYQTESTEVDRLRVRAATMTFAYTDESTQPSTIVLDGNVIVEHPQGTVVAAHAEWAVGNEVIIFTGSPKMTAADGPTVTGERAEFNLRTGRAKISRSKVTGLQLNNTGMGGGQSPALLSVSDVSDWPALLTGLKTEGSSDAPSPGRQIVQFIDPAVRRLLPGIDATKVPPAENQSVIIKQVNRALNAPGLYNEAAWQGKNVDSVVGLMLEKGTQQLNSDELALMNRRLLEAAYPGAIVRFEAPTAP